jgi:hypothetical protein
MAGHIAAHAHLGTRRRPQEEVRIEAGDRLQLVERDGQALRQRPQFTFGEITMRPLNAAEFVEDWRCASTPLHALGIYHADF